MAGDFEGLVAIVTGGASGIGATVTSRLLAAGSKVAVLDLDPLPAPSGAFRVRVDIADGVAVEHAVDEVVAEYGRIDIVVNNAGVGAQGTIEHLDEDEWARAFSINVTGMARVSRAALPHLRRSPSPAIVNTSSIAATAGLPDRALYSASKGAVLALTRAMAADHLVDGVRVNCVSPGTTDTPWVSRLLENAVDPEAERSALEARQPHGRLVSMVEVADAILYLAGPRSASTNGISLEVDGGMQSLRVRKG
jgi:NAD(P)-dependent dehydrogenase (short-subunit alcohol dehydrogenase family)